MHRRQSSLHGWSSVQQPCWHTVDKDCGDPLLEQARGGQHVLTETSHTNVTEQLLVTLTHINVKGQRQLTCDLSTSNVQYNGVKFV